MERFCYGATSRIPSTSYAHPLIPNSLLICCSDFIATTYTSGPVLTPKPAFYDVHVYQTPSEQYGAASIYNYLTFFVAWFAQNSFMYDSFQVYKLKNLYHTPMTFICSGMEQNILR